MTTIRSRGLAALIAGALALIAAGCGGPAPAASPAAATASSQQAFSACMRTHGVANFPDLTSGKLAVEVKNGKTTVNGTTLNVSSTTYQAAEQACRSKLSGQTQSASNVAQLKQKALQFAQCMRSHGVTNFPDPTVGSNGQVTMQIQKGSVDTSSPQFKAAQQACGNIMPLPGGNG